MANRPRREPMILPPLVAGECDYCGGEIPKTAKNYCSPECRSLYISVCIKQGKQIVHVAKIWRKYRGRKKTPAEGKMQMLASRLDELLTEDRERKESCRKSR